MELGFDLVLSRNAYLAREVRNLGEEFRLGAKEEHAIEERSGFEDGMYVNFRGWVPGVLKKSLMLSVENKLRADLGLIQAKLDEKTREFEALRNQLAEAELKLQQASSSSSGKKFGTESGGVDLRQECVHFQAF